MPTGADVGQQLRDDAIERLGAAHMDFVRVALEAARRVARRMASFTADDVWMDLHANGEPMPREPRVLGAVMTQIEKQAIAAPTAEFKLSVRPASHRRPLRVWKSLIRTSRW